MLQHQFPTLSTFSTLSPIPQFMAWLAQKAKVRAGTTAALGNCRSAVLCRAYMQSVLSVYITSTAGRGWPRDAARSSAGAASTGGDPGRGHRACERLGHAGRRLVAAWGAGGPGLQLDVRPGAAGRAARTGAWRPIL